MALSDTLTGSRSISSFEDFGEFVGDILSGNAKIKDLYSVTKPFDYTSDNGISFGSDGTVTHSTGDDVNFEVSKEGLEIPGFTGIQDWLSSLFSINSGARVVAVLVGLLLLGAAVWALANAPKG